MNPACSLCRGACCESMVLNLPPGDIGIWLRYHGEPVDESMVELNTPCRMLCEGKCRVWDTRPKLCELYEVGGQACLATIKRKRPNWREIVVLMSANPSR